MSLRLGESKLVEERAVDVSRLTVMQASQVPEVVGKPSYCRQDVLEEQCLSKGETGPEESLATDTPKLQHIFFQTVMISTTCRYLKAYRLELTVRIDSSTAP